MASLFNQTNKNQNRYFFATTEAGEQELYLSNAPSGPITDTFVGISGPAGNMVQINQMPDIIGTTSVGGEEMVYAGTASTYKTLSTLSATATGVSLSSDRIPGTGIATIESYRSNGSTGGFEFLSRGVNSELLSTPINSYMSTIGRPGASAVLGASGNFIAGGGAVAPLITAMSAQDTGGGVGCLNVQDLSGIQARNRWSWFKTGIEVGGNTGTNLNLGAYDDSGNFLNTCVQAVRATGSISTINAYAYPQPLFSTVCSGSQTVTLTSNVPAVLFSTTSVATSNLIAGQNYLVDLPAGITCGAPGGTGAFLELGARIGGAGAGFNYLQTMYIPPTGLPAQGVTAGIVQVCDMGATNKNLELIGYLQGPASLSVTTLQPGGGAVAYMKQIT